MQHREGKGKSGLQFCFACNGREIETMCYYSRQVWTQFVIIHKSPESEGATKLMTSRHSFEQQPRRQIANSTHLKEVEVHI